MRNTSTTIAILETLSQADRHLTSNEVYAFIKDRLPAINPSTVYRALDRLAAEGKISVSDLGKGALVYEMIAGHRHHHLVCQACGEVVTMEDEEVEAFFAGIEKRRGFRICTNHLILYGTCQECL